MPDTSLWRWREWELIHVQREGDRVVLDGLELPEDPAEASDTLVTIELQSTDPAGLDTRLLVDTLAAWVASDATCGVILHQAQDSVGTLALLQESQLLVIHTT